MCSMTRVSIDGDTQMAYVNCSTLNDLKNGKHLKTLWYIFYVEYG